MKTTDRHQWIFLALIWCVFLFWEFQILIQPSLYQDYEVRYDLLVLPILFLVTGYMVYDQVKTEHKPPKK